MITTSGTCQPALKLASLLEETKDVSPDALLVCEDGIYEPFTIDGIRICYYVCLEDQGRPITRFLTEEQREKLLTEEAYACVLELAVPVIVLSFT